MINALKLATIQRGHVPRDLTLIASGGGGPMHAASLARELGVKRVVVPPHAGLFSAWGMLAARPRVDLHRSRLEPLAAPALPLIAEIFVALEAEAASRLKVASHQLICVYAIEKRYAGQERAIETQYAPGASVETLLQSFTPRTNAPTRSRLPTPRSRSSISISPPKSTRRASHCRRSLLLGA